MAVCSQDCQINTGTEAYRSTEQYDIDNPLNQVQFIAVNYTYMSHIIINATLPTPTTNIQRDNDATDPFEDFAMELQQFPDPPNVRDLAWTDHLLPYLPTPTNIYLIGLAICIIVIFWYTRRRTARAPPITLNSITAMPPAVSIRLRDAPTDTTTPL